MSFHASSSFSFVPPPPSSAINFSRPLRSQLAPRPAPPPPSPRRTLLVNLPTRTSSRLLKPPQMDRREPLQDRTYALRTSPVLTVSSPPRHLRPLLLASKASSSSSSSSSTSSAVYRDLRRLHRRQTDLLEVERVLTPAEMVLLQTTQRDILDGQAQLRDGPIRALPYPLVMWSVIEQSTVSVGGGKETDSHGSTSRVVDSPKRQQQQQQQQQARLRPIKCSPVRGIHHGKQGAKPPPKQSQSKPYLRVRSDSSNPPGSPARVTRLTSSSSRSKRTPLKIKEMLGNMLHPHPHTSYAESRSSGREEKGEKRVEGKKNGGKRRADEPDLSSPPPPTKRAKRQFSFSSLRAKKASSPHPEKKEQEEGEVVVGEVERSAGVEEGGGSRRSRMGTRRRRERGGGVGDGEVEGDFALVQECVREVLR